VRLFFGLKGNGTLWLDDIDFRYSKWNFSALERLKPFFGRAPAPWEGIIPTPKRIEPTETVALVGDGGEDPPAPVIVLPGAADPAERAAARLLQEKLTAVMDGHSAAAGFGNNGVRILEGDFPPEDLPAASLVFSVGRTRLLDAIGPELPLAEIAGEEQGYVVKGQPHGGARIVFLLGNTPVGTYYAAATAVQLVAAETAVYHDALVVDSPDFLGRSFCFRNWKSAEELQEDLQVVERMTRFKLNKVYTGYNRTDKSWYKPSDLFQRGVAEAGRRLRENGLMHLAVMVNPYSHLPMEASAEALDEADRTVWTHSSPESLERLQQVFAIGLEAGADTVMLLSDDFVPHTGWNRKNYALYSAEDRRRFVNLQNAQAYVVNRLKQWIDRRYPGVRFEFCPPWYANELIDNSDGRAEVYFDELVFQIPPEVAVIWTGPTIRSLSIDAADHHRYASLIGRQPMIWDNTLYARALEARGYGGYPTHYPGKTRLCNLFEPFDGYRPPGFHRLNDGRHMYTNAAADSEVYRIKYATVADFEWNTAAYDPERSLWKALCAAYGPRCAEALVYFNDAYYGLLDTSFQMELAGVREPFVSNGKGHLQNLEARLQDISRLLPEGHPLVKELEAFRDRQKRRYEKVTGQHPQEQSG
jgi:hypothetical protein